MKSDGNTENIGTVPCCQTCGSERVVKDAWACFNPESGLWELETVFDDTHCHKCGGKPKLAWSAADQPPHKRIRELSDLFRTQGKGKGSIMLTDGVQGLGGQQVVAVMSAIRAFNAFSDDSDPRGEHDFGALELDGEKVFFKFDYYAPDLQSGSENPANEGVTHRVLTVMLANEY